jgi:hypothetical protein
MNTLVSEHLSGHVDYGNRLWMLLTAEVWYRMHIKKVSRPTMAGGSERLAG